MRRRVAYRPYVLLLIVFFFVMSLPEPVIERVRSIVVTILAPSWRGAQCAKGGFLSLMTLPVISAPSSIPSKQALKEVDYLHQENQILHAQMNAVREWLLFEEKIDEQMHRLKAISEESESEAYWKQFFKRRREELCSTIELQMKALPAKVIYREPATWSSSLWIDVGLEDNERLGKEVIAKNSPVVVNTSVVGIVEYVGVRHSRIRLITDSGLVPAVRAVRGEQQNRYLLEHLEALLQGIEARRDLFVSNEEIKACFQVLEGLKIRLGRETKNFYLAKGELYGTSHPLWRLRSQVLRGVGFNYDYSDKEGPARDLRSGEVIEGVKPFEAMPLLREGDLLVTSGLDGIFPPGFRVGMISKIKRLREGGSAYELEAFATAGNLEELDQVFVLPALGFEKI
jgi:cell shape-determining protein MreC